MFSYIRYFSAIAFVLVLVAGFLVGQWFKQLAGDGLVEVINANSASLAQGFINTVWRENHQTIELYERFQRPARCVRTGEKYPEFKDLAGGFNIISKKVFKYFEDMPIVGVSIYMADGTRIIDVDQSKIAPNHTSAGMMFANGPEKSLNDLGFSKALNGTASHTIEMNGTFYNPDGSTTRGTLIKTTIPIIMDYTPVLAMPQNQTPVEGVIQIQFDITQQWRRLDIFQWIATGGIIGIFSVLIVVLSVTTNKAESIIAKQHEANIELAGQAAAAQAENRDKSQFLANVSHELRTPLNAIIGFSEFIKGERSGPIGNERYAEYIRDIHGSGVHLLSLINDILDYSKAEADKLDLEISEVDATKTVRNSLRLILPRAEQAEVQLIDEIPREHFILITDQKKLKQVMLNLLSNAVKFTKPKGTVTITMWHNVSDESICVEVRDTGIGIAPKDISRAMAPFGQVDSALSRKYEGTGLGLPLTKKFVEIMGGTFKIESEVDVGTAITFTLPKEAPAHRRKPQDATLKMSSQKKPTPRLSIPAIRQRKSAEPLVVLTAYTGPIARLLDPHVDILLVGDSLGMVVYGMDSTHAVTVEMMVNHAKAVVKHSEKACVVVDMPFGSYQESPLQAFRSAARIIAETGAQAVKLEGGAEMAETIRFLTERGIPVMGHVGLKPQHVLTVGGYKYQGRTDEEREAILADAKAVEAGGAFAVVIEATEESLSAEITKTLVIPTIGIGASAACDGQVLVIDDVLGMFDFSPSFVKKYADLAPVISDAAKAYAQMCGHANFRAMGIFLGRKMTSDEF